MSSRTLSHGPVSTVTIDIDYHQLARDQATCIDLQHVRNSKTGLCAQDCTLDASLPPIACDTSRSHPRPFIPSLRRVVFYSLHGIALPGVRGTQAMIGDCYVWPHMRKDISTWCRQCIRCQAAKVHTHVHAPVHTIPTPDVAFSHVHINIVGPLPPSRGFSYILTVVDRTTHWPAAIPLVGVTADECAHAFCLHWVAEFGIPLHITSDHGRRFISTLWTHLAHLLRSTLHCTTSYHPQSNGLIEWFHHSLKSALRARLAGSDWYDHLPWTLLALCTTVKEDLDASPAALNLRHLPMLPVTLVSPLPTSPDLPTFAPSHHTATTPATSGVPAELTKAQFVFLRLDGH